MAKQKQSQLFVKFPTVVDIVHGFAQLAACYAREALWGPQS